MFRNLGLAASLTLAALTQSVHAVDKTRDPELIAKLITANSQLDRLDLLGSDEDWFFDFNIQQPFYNFAPGGVVNMNSATFPAAKGNGMTSKWNLRTQRSETNRTCSTWRGLLVLHDILTILPSQWRCST